MSGHVKKFVNAVIYPDWFFIHNTIEIGSEFDYSNYSICKYLDDIHWIIVGVGKSIISIHVICTRRRHGRYKNLKNDKSLSLSLSLSLWIKAYSCTLFFIFQLEGFQFATQTCHVIWYSWYIGANSPNPNCIHWRVGGGGVIQLNRTSSYDNYNFICT